MVSFSLVTTLADKFPASNLELRTSNQNGYDSFLSASRSLPIISLISSFLQVPTLNLYQLLLREVPKA